MKREMAPLEDVYLTLRRRKPKVALSGPTSFQGKKAVLEFGNGNDGLGSRSHRAFQVVEFRFFVVTREMPWSQRKRVRGEGCGEVGGPSY